MVGVERRYRQAASNGNCVCIHVNPGCWCAGLGSEVQARVSAMEAQAKDVSEKLVEAASEGTYAVYRIALDSARRYTHLCSLVEESERIFGERRGAAEKLLHAAVEGRPQMVR